MQQTASQHTRIRSSPANPAIASRVNPHYKHTAIPTCLIYFWFRIFMFIFFYVIFRFSSILSTLFLSAFCRI